MSHRRLNPYTSVADPDRQSRRRRASDQVSTLYELGLLNKRDVHPGKRAQGRTGTLSAQTGGGGSTFENGSTPISDQTHQPARRAESSKGSLTSKTSLRSNDLKKRTGGGMSGMLDVERSRTRRERTFVGSECAVCEEPLEHTLAGERILQFSCGHVSHGACFYAYIKEYDSHYCPTCNAPLGLDTSRGGNAHDLAPQIDLPPEQPPPPVAAQWENPPTRSSSRDAHARSQSREPQMDQSHDGRDSRDRGDRDLRDSRDQERFGPSGRRGHARTDSEATGAGSAGYPETTLSGPVRRHDYDLQSMESNLISLRASFTRNPIPSPLVRIRSEYPTLTRSRQQQTLTCLITVEVPDNKWRADPEDLRKAPAPPNIQSEDIYADPPSPPQSVATPVVPKFYPYEAPEALEEVTENLRTRVENWHGLDFSRFGKLRLYGTIRVGKDKQAWQELECYLFSEMLICVKEKKTAPQLDNVHPWDGDTRGRNKTRCTLKGSILIKKHLNGVTQTGGKDQLGLTEKITSSNLRPGEDNVLTLSLSVAELPSFHLQFDNRNQLKLWQQALLDLNAVETSAMPKPNNDTDDEDEWQKAQHQKRASSINSSAYGPHRTTTTAPTDYTANTEYTNNTKSLRTPTTIHVPIDVVVVVPISSSMHGVKISLVRDALKFMVANLGDRDRMGLVTFGSASGGVPLIGMTAKTWSGWPNILATIKPVGQKHHRADVVDGANVAMDLLMQRKSNNPIATILLISDSSTSDAESVDFVVSRAEAAKIGVHSFGLGMTHKPDTMIELATRTKATYTYVKDWMMLRECLAGCLGALQTMSHQNIRLKLRLPEGSPAKFVKISGALQITKRATGRDAEAALGDLHFGEKRDILVQLVITPDSGSPEQLPQDPWESIVSGLEALGGPLDAEDQRTVSIEELPLIQADLTWGDILREGTLTHLPRPSLLAITMLPALPTNPTKKSQWPSSPPIPPHPSVVQRRMELLTSDMLTRALGLVSRGQHDRAQHLLNETRSILKGLGKGGLPPIPPPTVKSPNSASGTNAAGISPTSTTPPNGRRTPSPTSLTSPHNSQSAIRTSRSHEGISSHMSSTSGIDPTTVAALDAELEASLEWISHPAVFSRDSRKAVLQAIGVISSQRGYTFRTPVESLWAARISGVQRLMNQSREWREEGGGEGGIMEES